MGVSGFGLLGILGAGAVMAEQDKHSGSSMVANIGDKIKNLGSDKPSEPLRTKAVDDGPWERSYSDR
jgi:hypothetical protein